MCPKAPEPVVNKPAYAPNQIDTQIDVTATDTATGAKVGSPAKTTKDASVPSRGSGVMVRR